MCTRKSEMYPPYTREITKEKEALTPKEMEAWRHFSRTIFEAGALPEMTKQIIAVAVAHDTQCPYCIKSHTKQALKKGASKQQLMEAIWIATEMRAGSVTAHAAIAIDTMDKT